MKNITVKIFAGLFLLNISTTNLFGIGYSLIVWNSKRAKSSIASNLHNWVTSSPRLLSALTSCYDFGSHKTQALMNFGKSVAHVPGRLSSAADSYLNDPSSDEFPLSRVDIAKVTATNYVRQIYDCTVHDVHTAATVGSDLIGVPLAIMVGRPLGVLVRAITQPTVTNIVEKTTEKLEPFMQRAEALPQQTQTAVRGALQDGRLALFGPQTAPIAFQPRGPAEEEEKETATTASQPFRGIIPELQQTCTAVLQQGAATAQAVLFDSPEVEQQQRATTTAEDQKENATAVQPVRGGIIPQMKVVLIEVLRRVMQDASIVLMGHQDPVNFDQPQTRHEPPFAEDRNRRAPEGVLHQALRATQCMLRDLMGNAKDVVVGGVEARPEDSLAHRLLLMAREHGTNLANSTAKITQQRLTKVVGWTCAGTIAALAVHHKLKTRQPIVLQTKTGGIKTLLPIKM